MKIEHVKISDLKMAVYNPRQISNDDMASLVNSIREFEIVEPIVVNKRTGNVVGGHQRIIACKQLSIEEVPVVYVNLDEKKEKVLNLALNRIHGDWDMEKLSVVLGELKLDDMADLSLTGFSEIELGEIVDKPKAESHLRDRMDWKDLDNLFLDEKEIQKRYEKTKQIIVSFSGGKDSTACLILLRKYFPEKTITAVFVDPGIEFPGMSVHTEEIAKILKCNLVIVKPQKDFWIETLKRGWPNGMIPWCRNDLIHKPFGEFVQKFDSKDTLLCDGSRGDQAMRFSKKSRFSSLPTLKKYQAFHPIFDLKKEEQDKFLASSNIPLWEGYQKGFVRTACWCCPMQCASQGFALQQNYPGLADYIRYWEKKIDQKLQHNLGNAKPRYFDDLVRYGKQLSKQKKH